MKFTEAKLEQAFIERLWDEGYTHSYLAFRSIVSKLTKGNASDTAQMNVKVREMIKDALEKVHCARVHFKTISTDMMKFDVVNSYQKFMEVVK